MGHYAGALRLCVTVRYGDMLQYVTLMRYGVSRWRVMAVCYGALRRYVTVRYGALRCFTLMRYGGALRCVTLMRCGVTSVRYGAALHRCITAVHYGVLQHYITTVHGGSALQYYVTVVRYADTLLCMYVCVCVHVTDATVRHRHTFARSRRTSK